MTLSPPIPNYKSTSIEIRFIIGTESVIEFMQRKRMILITNKITL